LVGWRKPQCYRSLPSYRQSELHLQIEFTIHGFGLSTRLQELPLSEDSLLLNIISFNVGIELGQISALALMLLLIATWRKSHFFQTFSVITNYSLIIAGALLFLMQMHGYEHTANSEELIASANASQITEIKEDVAEVSGSVKSQQAKWKDTINVTIPARGDKEYKLLLAKGATLEYSWQTDGENLFFDFHGEPAGDKTGFFQSFEKDTNSQSSGSLTTSFEGTHGWYWKNNTRSPVVITLKIGGDYQRIDLEKVIQDSAPAQKPTPTTHDSIDSL